MKIRVLISYEWKRYLADKKALGMILLAPLFLLVLSAYVLTPLLEKESSFQKFDIALVNLDSSWETRSLVQHLESAEEIRQLLKIHHLSLAEAQQRLLAKQVAALIIIPKDFSTDLKIGKNTPVEVIGHPERPFQAELIRLFMQSGADLISAAQSGVNTIYFYLHKAQVSASELEQVFRQTVVQFTLQSLARGELFENHAVSLFEGLTATEYYAVSISILFVLVSGLLAVQNHYQGGKLLEQRLVGVGVTVPELVLARWFSQCILLMWPYLFYYLALGILFDDFFRGNSALFLLVSLLVLGAIGAFYQFLGAVIRQQAQFNVLSLLLILTMSLVGGSLLPLAYLPAGVETWSIFSLNLWAMRGLLATLFEGNTVMLGLSIAVLTLWTSSLLLLSMWLGKRRMNSC